MKFTTSILLCLQMIASALPVSADSSLSMGAEEIASLQLMREEEKLAYDVYCYLFELYGDRPFSNISSAEQRHTQSVLWLMETFDVPDKGSSVAGKFNNATLQALYDNLIEIGKSSREMAFAVGVIIEETDISDLNKSIEGTDNPDIKRVFEALRSGSYRHLNAFQMNLNRVSKDPEQAHRKVMEAISKLIGPVA